MARPATAGTPKPTNYRSLLLFVAQHRIANFAALVVRAIVTPNGRTDLLDQTALQPELQLDPGPAVIIGILFSGVNVIKAYSQLTTRRNDALQNTETVDA